MQRRINQKLSDMIHREEEEGTGRSRNHQAPSPRKDRIEVDQEFENENTLSQRPRSSSKSIARKSSSRDRDRDYGNTNKAYRTPSSERSQIYRNPNWESNQSTNELDIEEEVENEDSDEDDEDDEVDEEESTQLPYGKLRNSSSNNLYNKGNTSNSGLRKKGSITSTNSKSVPSSSTVKRGSGIVSSGSREREITALPIGFPEPAYDMDTFKRYLSRSESGLLDTTNREDSNDSPPRATNTSSYRPSSRTKRSSSKPILNTLLTRKIMALSQAIMVLALLSGSCSQLRFVYTYASIHAYSGLNYFLVCSTIIIEIFVGIGYIILSRFKFSEYRLEKIHSYLIFAIFYAAIATVILSAFGLEGHICEQLLARKAEKEKEQFDTIDQPRPHVPVVPTVDLQPMQIMVQNRMNPQLQQEEIPYLG